MDIHSPFLKRLTVCLLTFLSSAVLSVLLNLLRFHGKVDWLYATHFFNSSYRFPVVKAAMLAVLSLAVAISFWSVRDHEPSTKDPTGKKAGVTLLLVVLLLLLNITVNSADGIKFNDDSVTFGSGNTALLLHEVSYEELQIYQVEEYEFHLPSKYHHYRNYYPYQSAAYAVSDGNGHYFDFGELSEEDAVYQQLMHIAKQYGKEIKPLQHVY